LIGNEATQRYLALGLLSDIEPRNQDFAINFLIDPFAVFFCQHEISSAPLAYDYIIKLAGFCAAQDFSIRSGTESHQRVMT